MVRVAAKPSRPALRPAKASGGWAAAVAFSATGSAPLQATSARACDIGTPPPNVRTSALTADYARRASAGLRCLRGSLTAPEGSIFL